MQNEIDRLAHKLVEAYKQTPPERRLLVAIAGPPGSGKSTLAYPLTDRVNALLLSYPPAHPSTVHSIGDIATTSPTAGQSDDIAICVGLDGWHRTRAELDGFLDPVEAHWQRGAAYTFDLESYHTFLIRLRFPLIPPPADTPFPTFDHALKDPAPSPLQITPGHRIVIIEGLYTLLDVEGWREYAEMMDIRVFVSIEREVSRNRVIRHNFAAGIVDSLEKCVEKVDAVDMVNGELVRNHRFDPTDIVSSFDDPTFVPPAEPAEATEAMR